MPQLALNQFSQPRPAKRRWAGLVSLAAAKGVKANNYEDKYKGQIILSSFCNGAIITNADIG